VSCRDWWREFFYLSQHVPSWINTRERQNTSVGPGRLEPLVDLRPKWHLLYFCFLLLDDGRWEPKPSKFQPHRMSSELNPSLYSMSFFSFFFHPPLLFLAEYLEALKNFDKELIKIS
jgi:hypothetical protein